MKSYPNCNCSNCDDKKQEKEVRLENDLIESVKKNIRCEVNFENCIEDINLETKNKYISKGIEIGKLVSEKQKAYGDSFSNSGDILRKLFPNGITVDKYDDLLAITRIIDKLFRIANQKDAFGESPYNDILGYALLGVCAEKGDKK